MTENEPKLLAEEIIAEEAYNYRVQVFEVIGRVGYEVVVSKPGQEIVRCVTKEIEATIVDVDDDDISIKLSFGLGWKGQTEGLITVDDDEGENDMKSKRVLHYMREQSTEGLERIDEDTDGPYSFSVYKINDERYRYIVTNHEGVVIYREDEDTEIEKSNVPIALDQRHKADDTSFDIVFKGPETAELDIN